MKKAPQPKHYNAKIKKSSIDLSTDDAVEKIWNEFWVPLFETQEPSMQQIKDELGGFYFIMIHASLVYEEVTGGRMTNVQYQAREVLANYALHVQDMATEMKQQIFDDLKEMATSRGNVNIDKIAEYLEVDKK